MRKISILCMLLACGRVYADGSQWVLWDPLDYKPKVTVQGDYNEKSTDFLVNFDFPAVNPIIKAIDVEHLGTANGEKGKREVFNWILGPKDFELDVSGHSVHFYNPSVHSGVGRFWERGQPSGIFAYAGLIKSDVNHPVTFDVEQGQTSSDKMPPMTIRLTYQLTVPSDIPSGNHKIHIPNIKLGLEEHKFWGDKHSDKPLLIGDAIWSLMRTTDVSFDLNISTKCNYDVKQLNINHGVISPGMVNTAQPVFFTISCNRPANVTLELSGDNGNKTKCGEGGECMIEFDEPHSSKKVKTINGFTGINTSKIFSTFYPGKNSHPGEFSGSAILKVNVQ
ncbi:TPA: hypothetical protein JZG53_004609 [Escherichia coli]|uniref:hypothetical protein n=1 Tax=Escherichia coli TaxID=562 RepID=UPI0010CB3903|nr:hypothetical protein [Escherichia coli]GDA12191.1 hypothetical protein HmCmsJML183_04398 [Escherichia coli]HAX5303095.1 hypothetical protein [Escherichia coli]